MLLILNWPLYTGCPKVTSIEISSFVVERALLYLRELNWTVHERQKYFRHNSTCLCCHLSEANLNLCGRTETKMNICVKVYNPRLTTKEWYSLHEVHFKSSFKWAKNILLPTHYNIFNFYMWNSINWAVIPKISMYITSLYIIKYQERNFKMHE